MVNNYYSAMANIPYDSPYGGQSIIVSPNGETLAQVKSKTEEGFASVVIPIGEFRKERKLPQYSIPLTSSVISQYVEEIPPNHLDLPPNQLPQNGKEMKKLLDQKSRWLKQDEKVQSK